ncbi:hypothetical protein GCM10027168_70510 [Streptomyces capparidis]
MVGRTRIAGVVAAVCGLVSAGLIALVVAVDLDTAGQVAGITGSIAALAGLAVAVHALHHTPTTPPPPAPDPGTTTSPGAGTRPGPDTGTGPGSAAPTNPGTRSVTAGSSIGRAVTGNHNHLTTQTPSPPATGSTWTGTAPTGPAGTAPAAPERSVVAGGNIGEAITGDDNHT